ncbi:MAG: branched-chain amino acid ABC transporter permease [Desulfarculaceae bacterium]|nr:branched-chain amino acid ABC transporter permease [Desulfarculaceae bacterium]MCF8071628.1 branched-chain amino acid ABC transporter permease [Desulfarculaceae bacterium]MCF8103175.1 branched-chain amino acid ABC transporter permease [Desulfarculaceae bacterium]MCF8114907.1 branched-chain amino acid ABC transporter permease [Desulfarculaceae bacterium]
MEAIKNAFDFSDLPKTELSLAAAVLVFLLGFPALPHSSFGMSTMIQFLAFSLYGMGWNLIGGYGGQVDLGKAQYVGIGAYTTAVMMIRWNVPFWFSMPLGMAFAVGWSFIIGYPLFRLKGHYFAIATIATSLVLKDLFEVWDFVGGARGLELPIKGDFPNWLYLQFREDYYYYYILLAMFLVGLIYVNGFRHSRLGYQLRAIKDNEHVARSLGIDVHWSKIKAYAMATAFVAAVGSFHACYNYNIEPEDVMSLDLSVLIAMMAMLGGAGSIWGPIIGAAILVPMKNYLGSWLGGQAGFAGMDLALYGLIIMVIAAAQPRGVYGIVEAVRARRR